MLITDVMREADNEHVIYFLLTAYVDSMRFGGEISLVSESITRLPISGIVDLDRRFKSLMIDLDRASKNLDDKTCEIVKEALEVFSTALTCLHLLSDVQRSVPAALASSAISRLPYRRIRPPGT